MRAWAIGSANIRRMLRERSNIFFVFIFPIAIILLIGAQFGGDFDPVIGLYVEESGTMASSIVEEIHSLPDIEVRDFASEDELFSAVEQGSVQAGLSLPGGLDETAAAGDTIDIAYVARTDGSGPQLQAVLDSALADLLQPVAAAQFASSAGGVPLEQALAVAEQVNQEAATIDVEVTAVGEALFPASLGQFDLGASSQLVLFTFLTALAGSAALILTRQLGISQRMLSTPTPLGTIVVGESFGRFGTAMVQGIYIILLTLIMFQVNWGDPVGAVVLLVAFSAVGAAAGVLMGSVFSNDQQAVGVGIVLSIGLGALGGCMVPLELFSPTMQRVAHITPHAWALDGYAELVRRGGTTLDILPELGVLVAYAAGLFALAAWRLRVAITRP